MAYRPQYRTVPCPICGQMVSRAGVATATHRRAHERELVETLVAIGEAAALGPYASVESLQVHADIAAPHASQSLGYVDGDRRFPRKAWWANLLTEVNALMAAGGSSAPSEIIETSPACEAFSRETRASLRRRPQNVRAEERIGVPLPLILENMQ